MGFTFLPPPPPLPPPPFKNVKWFIYGAILWKFETFSYVISTTFSFHILISRINIILGRPLSFHQYLFIIYVYKYAMVL